MPNLINDGSLVGFWPLNEPSGAPFFKNYSPAYAKYPSGISFDMHVAVATTSAASITKQFGNSVWPGRHSFINAESGVRIQGYQVPGHWKLATDSSPFSKYLVVGGGGRQQAEQFLGPSVAQSGFTVGTWVYPYTNGNLLANEDSTSIVFTGYLTRWVRNSEGPHWLARQLPVSLLWFYVFLRPSKSKY